MGASTGYNWVQEWRDAEPIRRLRYTPPNCGTHLTANVSPLMTKSLARRAISLMIFQHDSPLYIVLVVTDFSMEASPCRT